MQVVSGVWTFTTDEIIAMNNNAIKENKERFIPPDLIMRLDPDGGHAEWMRYAYNDCEYRLGLDLKLKGTKICCRGWVDIPFEVVG